MDRPHKPLSALVEVEEFPAAPPADVPWLGFLSGLAVLVAGLALILLSRKARLAIEERDDADDAPIV